MPPASAVAADAEDAVAEVAVAVAQFAPSTDQDANLREIRRLVTTAVDRGARVVVLPEYSAYFDPAHAGAVAAAQPLDGPFARGLASIAAESGAHVVAGMLEEAEDPARFHNTVVAVDPSGEVVARYRKLHLYDAFGERESDHVEPGGIAPPETFEVDGVRMGLQTCYDIRFPESVRRVVDAGADVVLLPSEWVRGPLKEHHWRTLLTARAIENTVYLAAADHVPPVGVGASMVVDPMGVELATLGERVDVGVAWVSRARIDEVRRRNPALRLRRFGVVPL